MSALSPRRALLLLVPLTVLLAACGRKAAPPDAAQGLNETLPRCTAEDLAAVTPCQGADAGSECTPTAGTLVGPTTYPWDPPAAPKFTWTYPCAPDWYTVRLYRGYFVTVAQRTFAPEGEASSMSPRPWTPAAKLDTPGARYRYEVELYVGSEATTHGETWVLTGPLCVGSWHLSTPVPAGFADGFVYYVNLTQEQCDQGSVTLNWDYQNYDPYGNEYACLVRFEGQVSEDMTFTAGVMPMVSVSPFVRSGHPGGAVEWCHTYYYRVRAKTTEQVGDWSEPGTFKVAPPEGWKKCYEMPRQPISIEAVANTNAACRIGPSTAYGIAAHAAAGEKISIIGRNADGTWFQSSKGCYVKASLLTVDVVQGTPFPGGADVGTLMGVIPEVPDPPTPTVPVPVCKPAMGQGECAAAGGKWVCATKCVLACTESCTCDCP